jgi:hypothetical protein
VGRVRRLGDDRRDAGERQRVSPGTGRHGLPSRPERSLRQDVVRKPDRVVTGSDVHPPSVVGILSTGAQPLGNPRARGLDSDLTFLQNGG